MYNTASSEKNECKIGGGPRRGLAPCTDADRQFVTVIVLRARHVIYLYKFGPKSRMGSSRDLAGRGADVPGRPVGK